MNLQFSWIFSSTFLTNSSVTILVCPLPSWSWILVGPFLNLMLYWHLPPSVVTFFPYMSHINWQISIGLWFLANKKCITDHTSQLVGFSVEVVISDFYCLVWRMTVTCASMGGCRLNCEMPRNQDGRTSSVDKNVICFLDSPHTFPDTIKEANWAVEEER